MNYMDYVYGGSKKIGAPEESYLYSSSQEMSPSQSYLGGSEMDLASSGGGESAAGAGGAAMAGGMAGGPAGAAIGVGSQFLMNYLKQKAEDARQKKANAIRIEQEYANNQNKAFDSLGNYWGRALR